ncbi:MAG: NADH-quinone oxidoreductase subunit C [Candidatus Neomarinimicrobiota bacterium]
MTEKDLDKQIKDLVDKGLSGDMASVDAIEDRLLRGKVKAAIVKAKRLGVSSPKSVEKTNEPVPDDPIAKLVKEGLSGNMDSINSIEDRVFRAKVKSALVKAKKLAGSTNSSTEPEISSADSLNANNPNVKIGKLIQQKFPDSLSDDLNEQFIGLKREKWIEIAEYIKSNSNIYIDSLQCITGIDLGDNILQSRYNFHSMRHGTLIEIRISVTRDSPNIPSIEKIWRIGDWFERETYDMYGIIFDGHRDLRRMLLPEDWEGYPLRKDYKEQETYHGIVVGKIKEEAWD